MHITNIYFLLIFHMGDREGLLEKWLIVYLERKNYILIMFGPVKL